MKFPDSPIKGVPVAKTMEEVIDYLRPRPGMPGGPPNENAGTWDTLPPFWPILSGDGAGAYSFTLTDGYVNVDPVGTSTAPSLWKPSGLESSGERVSTAITVGQQIAIMIDTDEMGIVTGVSMVVEAEDTASIRPDFVSTDGEIHYKLAVLRAATGAYDAYLEYYLAGSNIYYGINGKNLDLRVYLVHSAAGVLSNAGNHYLCWREGHYIGKFATTPPSYSGSLDTDSVTYFTFAI